jgi:PAS domain S-box-containing protein
MTAVHPEDREKHRRPFGKGVRSGQGFAFETRSLRAQDGTYRWHLQQAVVLRDAEGKVLKFVGTTTDIDDQKRAANGPFLEYFNKTHEEIQNWANNDVVHPDDLPRAIAKFTYSLTTGTPLFDEHRYRRADGEYRWFDVRIYPARDTQGRITRWFTFSIDVHDRKLAEEALRASETNLRQTVNSIPGLICTMNPAGEIEELNRPLLEYFGKTPGELRGWRMTDAVHPDDLPEVIKAYTYSITNGTPYEIEHRYRRADGVYRWFQVRASAVRNTEGHITGSGMVLH